MSNKRVFRVLSALPYVWLISLLFFTSVSAQDASQLVINYVESQPVEAKYQYEVSIYFSLLDSTGNVIKNLQAEDITVSEDGKKVSIATLDLVTDEPIYISLLLDTSGSMQGSKNEDLIEASTEFINGLQEKDQIAVTTFNQEIKPLINFSTDHEAATNLVSSVEAVAKSGTCLYDAAYDAVQKTAALPLGRRAVIILTDGKDELLEGGSCSKLTIDDVINIASEGNIRVPIYTIGIGDSADEASLSRISKLTGGVYSQTTDTRKLSVLLNQLLDQLHSQFIIRYTSTSTPGDHTVVMNINHLNLSYTDSHGFVNPAMPLNLSIVSPVTGQQINDKVVISTTISGQGEAIEQVVFSLDNTPIGTDSTSPYELEWLPESGMNGEHTILVKALGPEDIELATDSVLVTVAMPEVPGRVSPDTPNLTSPDLFNNLPYIGVLMVILIGLGAFILVKSRKKRSLEKQRDERWNQMIVNPPTEKDHLDEMTMDGFVFNPDALGQLIVMQSDDPAMIGKRFEVLDSPVRLGRAEDNEIRFLKDSPVSRHHAIIENRNGQLVIIEMVSPSGDGTVKSPTFGTYVNETKILHPTVLQNGDLIKLGKRVVLRFESARLEMDNDARTIDQIDPDANERTFDSN